MIYLFFLSFACIRLLFLRCSIKNEKRLIENGGVEYGQRVSLLLVIVHTLIYFSAFFEGITRNTSLDGISFVGLLLVVASYIILVYVIHLLGKFWTVKLIIASDHTYIDHWLFERIQHPNYFLNILPELVGIILFFHAWWTGMFCLPIYVLLLVLRIKKENVMNKLFKNT